MQFAKKKNKKKDKYVYLKLNLNIPLLYLFLEHLLLATVSAVSILGTLLHRLVIADKDNILKSTSHSCKQ
jgi:hypothetical protein